jgi:hypothetical protein
MSSSTKLRLGAVVLVAAVLGTTFVWVPFPTELASTCCLVAVPVSPSVLLYLVLNRFERLKRYRRYVGFFLPVICVLTWAIVVVLLNRAEGHGDPDGGLDILWGLTEIYVIEVCVALVGIAGGEMWARRKAARL